MVFAYIIADNGIFIQNKTDLLVGAFVRYVRLLPLQLYVKEGAMNFLKLPKDLFFDDKYKDLSISAKVLYAFLLDRYSLSQKNNLIDDNGRVFIYFTRQEASKILKADLKSITKYFKQLKKVGLIYEKNTFLKANIIYIINPFSNTENFPVIHGKIPDRDTENFPTTNTDINNTDISQSKTDELLFKILQNCELEIWSDGTGDMLRSIITELYYLPFVYVHGVRFDTAYIRSKLVGLSADALIRMVDALKGKTAKNPRAYLISAILNAADDYTADLIINS